MSFLNWIRRPNGRTQLPTERLDRDTLSVAAEQLTFQRTGKSTIALCPRDIIAIWYDYNLYGWMHANSLRIVYVQHHQSTFIDVYDETHTYKLLLDWLQQHFPLQVASRYRELWGSPGGDYPSIRLWSANAHDT